jgi:aminopeptidase I
MADPNLSPIAPQSSSQAGTPAGPPQDVQTLGSRQSMQLCGNDDYTKALMNRVATGQASDADHAEFNKRAQEASAQNQGFIPPSALPFRGPPSKAELAEVGVAEDSKLPLQDYQMNLMLREQEHKKRLQMAGQWPPKLPSVSLNRPSSQVHGWPGDMVPGSSRPRPVRADFPNNPALFDYHMQLFLLEEQNRKRKHLATLEQGMADEWEESLSMRKRSTPSASMVQETQSPEPTLEPAFQAQNQMSAEAGRKPPRYPFQLDARLSRTKSERDKMLAWSDAMKEHTLQMLLPEEQKTKGQETARREHDQMEVDPGLGTEQKPSEEPIQDYETQLKLLEQENRKRLEMACQGVDRVDVATGYRPMQKLTEEQRQEYEMQLRILEQQNKKRLLMARQEQDRMEQNCFPRATGSAAEVYCKPFCDFLTDNPTVFHAVDSTKEQLKSAGWTELSERDAWDIKPSGRYFVERNGSSLIAFVVGANYEPGNGAAIIAGHVDALTAKLKPVSDVPNKAGYLQLGVAPYAGGLNDTWWDRDLGIGGRVLVKEGDKIVTKLVKLDWPIARIPTLAPHFGAAAQGPFNKETQMTPIIGLQDIDSSHPFGPPPILCNGANAQASQSAAFVSKQPPALVRAIGAALGLNEQTYGNIVNWELELFDIQPATVGGLNKEFIYGGRIDDKLCSWAAMQALTGSSLYATRLSSVIKVAAWFDNEEIGSGLRQGARSNFLPQVLERAVGSLSKHHPSSDLMGRTYANSYILSSDVTHAVNPNFLNAYLDNHAPRLNTGLVVAADANGHMTTDAVSTAILQRCADKVGAKLQVFQIRNDSRSGGTVGPMLSSMTGIRTIDAGMPQLSMHSIRATTGSLDPGLGVIMFTAFLNGFEHVDKEFSHGLDLSVI